MILQLELKGELPRDWIPIDVVSVIKCLDENGEPALAIRTSGGLTEWEMVGMLTCATDQLRDEMSNNRSNYHEDD